MHIASAHTFKTKVSLSKTMPKSVFLILPSKIIQILRRNLPGIVEKGDETGPQAANCILFYAIVSLVRVTVKIEFKSLASRTRCTHNCVSFSISLIVLDVSSSDDLFHCFMCIVKLATKSVVQEWPRGGSVNHSQKVRVKGKGVRRERVITRSLLQSIDIALQDFGLFIRMCSSNTRRCLS
ncbi:hypothetical protein BD560DRAFT_487699 [Blakeslea trispora]|nr:hypothetical protein BD560DRAFT_487697 [Blakeslea trispora]KAI8380082.1 hypothetical protein BD560DRAFT_487699 [Blakeslea trispora]